MSGIFNSEIFNNAIFNTGDAAAATVVIDSSISQSFALDYRASGQRKKMPFSVLASARRGLAERKAHEQKKRRLEVAMRVLMMAMSEQRKTRATQ